MPLEAYRHHFPQVHPSAYVHPSAVIIGDVRIGPRASVWPGCVLRGDQGSIEIGAESSIQDGTVVHATRGLSCTRIGARVTVGHKVILHGCEVEDDVLVGMGAILMDVCRVGAGSIVGAGALVPAHRQHPPGSLLVGSPARRVRAVTDDELERVIRHGHREYLRLCEEYRAGFEGTSPQG